MGVAEPRSLALQFVSNLQGMSLVANTLNEPGIVDEMTKQTQAWIESL